MLQNVRSLKTLVFPILFCGIVLPAQTKSKESGKAPIPSQIASARKVFISYKGADSISTAGFKWAGGDPDQPYNQFYAAIKSWGRYELTSTPGEAELVFEIRFATALYYDGKGTEHVPEWVLSIVETKTHFTLWTLTEPVKEANRNATWKKNIDESLAGLMDHLKQLTSAPQSGTQ